MLIIIENNNWEKHSSRSWRVSDDSWWPTSSDLGHPADA